MPWSLVYEQARDGLSSVASESLQEERGISGSAKCFKHFYFAGGEREMRETKHHLRLFHLSSSKKKYSDFNVFCFLMKAILVKSANIFYLI